MIECFATSIFKLQIKVKLCYEKTAPLSVSLSNFQGAVHFEYSFVYTLHSIDNSDFFLELFFLSDTPHELVGTQVELHLIHVEFAPLKDIHVASSHQ